MSKILTLGSLFDGIGGFPFCAEKNGIKTIWASEIEPFPIAISKQHFPQTHFYGDIKNLNGKDLEKVDIITAGSPCQDVSMAGKRAGLSGSKSSLFMEMIRIIKEMRKNDAKTKFGEKEIRPRILFWENVPGVFSSNKGQDFRTILEEICRIKDETISIPMPSKNKWFRAGCILANNFSLAWRVLDSQYFGVAQRRKRVFLIADFGGQSAPKILFESYGLSRNTQESQRAREKFTASSQASFGRTSETIREKIKCYDIGNRIRNPIESEEVSPCITSSFGTGGNNIHAVLPFDTSFCTNPDNHSNPQYNDPCHTLSCSSHIPKVAINYNYNQKNNNIYCSATSQSNSEILRNLSPTITSAAGTSGNNQPWITLNQASYSSYSLNNKSSTITNSGGTLGGGSENLSIRDNIIRKLTPLECERLQGFPDNWTILIKKEDMSDDEYDSWLKIYQNYKLLRNKSFNKNISKEKLINWYNKLECDSSRYKALGNSIAIPCVDFIMKRIKEIGFSEEYD